MSESFSKGRANPLLLGVFLSSVGMMAFEINFTRLFSVTQFYHFAFLVISLALLGYGTSGTLLAVYPQAGNKALNTFLSIIYFAQSIFTIVSYLVVNQFPFDSFTAAWDFREFIRLVIHLLLISGVFLFNGLAVGKILMAYPAGAGTTYGVSFLGSAIGSLLSLTIPSVLGGEGTVLVSCAISALAALSALPIGKLTNMYPIKHHKTVWFLRGSAGIIVILITLQIIVKVLGYPLLPALRLRLSPYKSLSYALQYPGAQIISDRWNAFSRVTIVQSPGIRSLPGLSYNYSGEFPAQYGIFIDGNDMSPIVLPNSNLSFINYLPVSLAYELSSNAKALILEPRGGLDILIALVKGAQHITAVEVNPLMVDAARHIYDNPKVTTIIETDRSYLKRTNSQFDIIHLSLTSSYHPVTSGAYSLSEDYRYTLEAFTDIYNHLSPNGIFILSRWLQNPPSECLRAFATAASAVESMGGDSNHQIIALRSYNMMIILVKKAPFQDADLTLTKQFASRLSLDFVFAPGLTENESNVHNVLPQSIYYKEFKALIAAPSRKDFYKNYLFNIQPATDNAPFFNHYFEYAQTRQILSNLGKSWQPFGGAGYFFVLGILFLTVLLSGTFVLLPLKMIERRRLKDSVRKNKKPGITFYAYFALIGFAYLFIEIPFLQQFTLYLGQPAYAMASILFSLLFFSGIGSRFSTPRNARLALPGLIILSIAITAVLPIYFQLTLGFSLFVRLVLTGIIIAPLGFLMGIPFPSGLQFWQGRGYLHYTPFAWGVNGASSVVSSTLAAVLALDLGFSGVFLAGSACYLAAWLAIIISSSLSTSIKDQT